MELTRDEVIRKLKDHQDYLSSEYGLRRIGIFGSYAQGTQSEESDIDIIVEFASPIGLKFVDFTEFIENMLGKKTDILTPAGVNGIRNPNIAQRIQETIVYV